MSCESSCRITRERYVGSADRPAYLYGKTSSRHDDDRSQRETRGSLRLYSRTVRPHVDPAESLDYRVLDCVFEGHQLDRQRLPLGLAHLRVEGGAPYLHEHGSSPFGLDCCGGVLAASGTPVAVLAS